MSSLLFSGSNVRDTTFAVVSQARSN